MARIYLEDAKITKKRCLFPRRVVGGQLEDSLQETNNNYKFYRWPHGEKEKSKQRKRMVQVLEEKIPYQVINCFDICHK